MLAVTTSLPGLLAVFKTSGLISISLTASRILACNECRGDHGRDAQQDDEFITSHVDVGYVLP